MSFASIYACSYMWLWVGFLCCMALMLMQSCQADKHCVALPSRWLLVSESLLLEAVLRDRRRFWLAGCVPRAYRPRSFHFTCSSVPPYCLVVYLNENAPVQGADRASVCCCWCQVGWRVWHWAGCLQGGFLRVELCSSPVPFDLVVVTLRTQGSSRAGVAAGWTQHSHNHLCVQAVTATVRVTVSHVRVVHSGVPCMLCCVQTAPLV